MEFTDIESEYLTSQRLGRLATIGPEGDPQNNPVGVHLNTGLGTVDIYGLDLAATRKFRNVRRNGRVALVVDDLKSVDPWHVRGIEIRGHAEALTDQTPPDPRFGREVIRVHPETVFSWGLRRDAPGMTKRTAA